MLIPCIKTENAIMYPVEIMVSNGWAIAIILIRMDKTPQTMPRIPFPLENLYTLTPAINAHYSKVTFSILRNKNRFRVVMTVGRYFIIIVPQVST